VYVVGGFFKSNKISQLILSKTDIAYFLKLFWIMNNKPIEINLSKY